MSGTGIVSVALLPVYAERDILQIRTDELLYGTKIKLTDTKERDRYRIETDYHYTGLVMSQGIICDERPVNAWLRKKQVVVVNRFCDILAQPSVKSRILLTVYRGSILADFGMAAEPGWYCVGLVDGSEGYVRQEYVKKYRLLCDELKGQAMGQQKEQPENILRKNLTDTAYSYLGTPYRWGGKTTLGIDCSGFTFMVYAMNGIYIHRDSGWEKESPVQRIADCEKKAGDLLYFPGHIALYLGNGEYIHSTARDGAGVTINSLRRGSMGFREDLERAYMFAGSVF